MEIYIPPSCFVAPLVSCLTNHSANSSPVPETLPGRHERIGKNPILYSRTDQASPCSTASLQSLLSDGSRSVRKEYEDTSGSAVCSQHYDVGDDVQSSPRSCTLSDEQAKQPTMEEAISRLSHDESHIQHQAVCQLLQLAKAYQDQTAADLQNPPPLAAVHAAAAAGAGATPRDRSCPAIGHMMHTVRKQGGLAALLQILQTHLAEARPPDGSATDMAVRGGAGIGGRQGSNGGDLPPVAAAAELMGLCLRSARAGAGEAERLEAADAAAGLLLCAAGPSDDCGTGRRSEVEAAAGVELLQVLLEGPGAEGCGARAVEAGCVPGLLRLGTGAGCGGEVQGLAWGVLGLLGKSGVVGRRAVAGMAVASVVARMLARGGRQSVPPGGGVEDRAGATLSACLGVLLSVLANPDEADGGWTAEDVTAAVSRMVTAGVVPAIVHGLREWGDETAIVDGVRVLRAIVGKVRSSVGRLLHVSGAAVVCVDLLGCKEEWRHTAGVDLLELMCDGIERGDSGGLCNGMVDADVVDRAVRRRVSLGTVQSQRVMDALWRVFRAPRLQQAFVNQALNAGWVDAVFEAGLAAGREAAHDASRASMLSSVWQIIDAGLQQHVYRHTELLRMTIRFCGIHRGGGRRTARKIVTKLIRHSFESRQALVQSGDCVQMCVELAAFGADGDGEDGSSEPRKTSRTFGLDSLKTLLQPANGVHDMTQAAISTFMDGLDIESEAGLRRVSQVVHYMGRGPELVGRAAVTGGAFMCLVKVMDAARPGPVLLRCINALSYHTKWSVVADQARALRDIAAAGLLPRVVRLLDYGDSEGRKIVRALITKLYSTKQPDLYTAMEQAGLGAKVAGMMGDDDPTIADEGAQLLFDCVKKDHFVPGECQRSLCDMLVQGGCVPRLMDLFLRASHDETAEGAGLIFCWLLWKGTEAAKLALLVDGGVQRLIDVAFSEQRKIEVRQFAVSALNNSMHDCGEEVLDVVVDGGALQACGHLVKCSCRPLQQGATRALKRYVSLGERDDDEGKQEDRRQLVRELCGEAVYAACVVEKQ